MRRNHKELAIKRKRRIERLMQKFGLLERREEINKVWAGMPAAAPFTHWPNDRRNSMHVRYIAMTTGFFGHWGVGGTQAKAVEKMRKSGAKTRDHYRVYRFASELPFAPADREATDLEADCWIGQDGSCNWIRCKRSVVTEYRGGKF